MRLNLDDKTMDYLTQILSTMKALKLESLTATANEFDSTVIYNFNYMSKWLTIEHTVEAEDIDVEKGIVTYDEYTCVDYYQIKGQKLIYNKTKRI